MNNLVVGYGRGTISGERQNERFVCVCGNVFSSARDRNIHRGEQTDRLTLDPGSVNSRD